MKKILNKVYSIFLLMVVFINSIYSKSMAIESTENIDKEFLSRMQPTLILIIGKKLRNVLRILIIPFIFFNIIMYYKKKKNNEYKKITKIMVIITALIIVLYYLLCIVFPDYYLYPNEE